MIHDLPHYNEAGGCVCECDNCLNDNARCICRLCNGECGRETASYKGKRFSYILDQNDSILIVQMLVTAIQRSKNKENLMKTFQVFAGQYMNQRDDA